MGYTDILHAVSSRRGDGGGGGGRGRGEGGGGRDGGCRGVKFPLQIQPSRRSFFMEAPEGVCEFVSV